MNWTEPAGRLGQFTSNMIVSTTCAHLIYRARKILKECLGETKVADIAVFREVVESGVKQYCVDPLGMSFADPMIRTFSDYAYQSADVARRSISDHCRDTVLRRAAALDGSIKCYCCGELLGKFEVLKGLPTVPLDHIWPRAFGGVSTDENLLPICEACNGLKMDRVSWDVYGVVQDYAASYHGTNGLGLTKLALHRCAALRLAELDGITVKEAFVRLGPFGSLESIHPEGGAWFFNRTAHDTRVLPELW